MKLVRREDGLVELRSTGVGYFRSALAKGDLVAAGQGVGEQETLGRREPQQVPAGVSGRVVLAPSHRRVAAMFDEVIFVLDPAATGAATELAEEAGAATTGLVFRSPMSGRFYLRPGPGEEPFVKAGQQVRQGQAVALLEVMKTFNRVAYGGERLPTNAVVRRVVPVDGADVEVGDVLLELED